MRFTSRRNFVRTVGYGGQTAVRKLFFSPEDWQREEENLRALTGIVPVPKRVASVPGILLMEYLPHPTLLNELERQEREGFSAAPWLSLRRWLEKAHACTSLVPSDGNLRNFLWDGAQVTGLDFENYIPGELSEALPSVAAFLLEYDPSDTPVKRQAARILFDGNPERHRTLLRERRMRKRNASADASFILLAGGKSSRMGQDKASLPLLGTSLLQLQLEKAQLMGIDDILVSGAREDVPGARVIPDVYPERGPLGGLHACLREAKHSRAVVLSVDMPLIPPSQLHDLLDHHLQDNAEITLGMHGDRWQPLAGVYNVGLHARIEPLIEASGAPVRALIKESRCRFVPSAIPDAFWANCNTPEEWTEILRCD